MDYFVSELDKKIIPHKEKKPRFALMQITGLPSKYGSMKFGKKQVGLLPFVRLWLEPTDILMELSGHADADFTLDLIFNGVHQLDDNIGVNCGKEDFTSISLSDEDQIAIRNYLDLACADAYGFDVMGLLEQSRISAENVYGKPGDPKVACPRCEMSFTPKPKSEVEGEYEAVIFECPTCGKKYIAAVSDAALRERIREWKRLTDEYNAKLEAQQKTGKFVSEKVLDFQKQMLDRMQKENTARMRELCEVYLKLKDKEDYGNAQKKADTAAGDDQH